jgi:hypothetical protein
VGLRVLCFFHSPMSAPPSDLSHALQDLLDELDRLILVGDAGRRRRGIATLSVETLRYLRIGAAGVASGTAAPESLRGIGRTLSEGALPGAPILSCAARVEGLL